MKNCSQIYFDITFTRTQVGNVGITRTVRRLREELNSIVPEGTECIPVAFHRGGYRLVDREPTSNSTTHARDSANNQFAARFLRWLTEGVARRFAFSVLPLWLLHKVWRLHSSWTFNSLSAQAQPAAFQPGDFLFLCDASWCCESWDAAKKAQDSGARIVLLVYDLIPIRQPEFCSSLTTRIFENWLVKMIPVSDAAIGISRSTAQDLEAYASEKNLKPPPIGFFRLGSDPNHKTKSTEIRSSLLAFFNDRTAFFASVGSIEPRKNYAFLLKIFENLWDDGINVRLLIAGRPTADCHQLVQQFKHHPQQTRNLFTLLDGTDDEISAIYSRCRALVLPSLAEGFGLPLVEARTRGCIVIASKLPSFVELADDGVFFADSASQESFTKVILQHLKTPEKYIEPMERFLWRDSAMQFLKVTKQLLNRK